MIKKLIKKVLFHYIGDGFCTSHNVSFLKDINFIKAYNKACKIVGHDSKIHFRIHQIFWAGKYCQKIRGDIVEIGTGTGFSMLALLNFLKNWNKVKKKLYLFDTFSPYKVDEFGKLTSNKSQHYATSFEKTKKNFENFKRINFVKGDVFKTLINYKNLKISMLHIDLNYAEAEVYSLNFLWKNISKGGIIILDDYAYMGRNRQFVYLNKLAKKLNFNILTVPSGQGIIIKN